MGEMIISVIVIAIIVVGVVGGFLAENVSFGKKDDKDDLPK